MQIVISNKRKIVTIQEEFRKLFPNLELFFHAKPCKSEGFSSIKLVTKESKSLKNCRTIYHDGTIEILPTMTISELKSNFSKLHGLSVEIFPKLANNFIEDDSIDNLTLEEINN